MHTKLCCNIVSGIRLLHTSVYATLQQRNYTVTTFDQGIVSHKSFDLMLVQFAVLQQQNFQMLAKHCVYPVASPCIIECSVFIPVNNDTLKSKYRIKCTVITIQCLCGKNAQVLHHPGIIEC